MSTVTELGYVGLSISNLDRWKAYACEIAGMELLDEGEGDRVYLRMDEWHHRIVLHLDGGDDLAYMGFRVAGPSEFAAMAEKLRGAGIEFRQGTAQEAAERRVLAVLKMVDPGGNKVEIFWGPRVDSHKPFHPGRPMFGRFVTGDQGMGHCALNQADLHAAFRFYEVLGFAGDIEYEIPLPDGMIAKVGFMHVNGRQHSIAFIPLPASTRINHMMFEYTNLKDIGIAHDIVRARKIPVAMQLGMHANDEQLSFYSGNPSGWSWELGWGGRQAQSQIAYHTRDVFGHAPEAEGFGLDLPVNG